MEPVDNRPSNQGKTGAKPEAGAPAQQGLLHRKTTMIAVLAITAIVLHLALRFGFHAAPGTYKAPLLVALALGGTPLIYDLLRKFLRREFGSDLLGGISIITSVLLGEYLAGSIIVLMLSGGEALESYALRSASSVLAALAKRMPSVAHRKRADGISDVTLDEIEVGDTLVHLPARDLPRGRRGDRGPRGHGRILPHRGAVSDNQDLRLPVISGAINGETALTIRTTQRAADSRYAKIMECHARIRGQAAEAAAPGRPARGRSTRPWPWSWRSSPG
jgi:cation transport ATPase